MKVSNYGEMLEKAKGGKCISFVEFGSYQGEWVAVIERDENVELWKGSYGSCSGCDWLEAEQDYSTGEVSDEKASEYFKEDHPFVVIPKETMRGMELETFQEVIPANIRSDIYDFDGKELYESIKKSI